MGKRKRPPEVPQGQPAAAAPLVNAARASRSQAAEAAALERPAAGTTERHTNTASASHDRATGEEGGPSTTLPDEQPGPSHDLQQQPDQHDADNRGRESKSRQRAGPLSATFEELWDARWVGARWQAHTERNVCPYTKMCLTAAMLSTRPVAANAGWWLRHTLRWSNRTGTGAGQLPANAQLAEQSLKLVGVQQLLLNVHPMLTLAGRTASSTAPSASLSCTELSQI